MDGLGRIPLVLAIEMAGSNNPHDHDEINFLVVLGRLLDDRNGTPKVASQPLDKNGTLPLYRALRFGAGLTDGCDHIAEAVPGALPIPNPQSHLIPFLLAAVGEQLRVKTL